MITNNFFEVDFFALKKKKKNKKQINGTKKKHTQFAHPSFF